MFMFGRSAWWVVYPRQTHLLENSFLSGNQEARQMNIIAEMAQDYKIN
jgi:hypothetical protein